MPPSVDPPASVELASADLDALSGRAGEAMRLAMRVIVAMAEAVGARRLIDVSAAHVDGCLYQGQVSLDFAERLADAGARVRVPTTLNVGALDLLHPERYRGAAETARRGRRLMELYTTMGCRPTWTCAPYQIPQTRPAFGQHVAWGESNAIVFANSVLGARTARYGDFVDVCAALTGRVPDAGLHRSESRRGQVLFRLVDMTDRAAREDVVCAVLGHLIGRRSGSRIPVVDGVPPGLSEDAMKALGAAAASSGSVGLFHVVGVTPEARTLADAFAGRAPEEVVDVTTADLARARGDLATAAGTRIDAVSVGTPHASIGQLERLAELLGDDRAAIPTYVNTGRDVLERVTPEVVARLERAGVTVVTDTCTYIAPVMDPAARVVMTDSAKWAYYGPANLGVDVVMGSLEECVRTAVRGRPWRDPELFRGS
jgi:predicted aconitase